MNFRNSALEFVLADLGCAMIAGLARVWAKRSNQIDANVKQSDVDGSSRVHVRLNRTTNTGEATQFSRKLK